MNSRIRSLTVAAQVSMPGRDRQGAVFGVFKPGRLDLAGCAATAHPDQGVVFGVLDPDCQFL